MLDTIHIIDEYLAKPKTASKGSSAQNFIMPGRETSPLPLPASIAISMLPGALVFAAVSAMPSLISLLSDDKDEDKASKAEKERLLAAFVERATFSPQQARDEGYRFQPGHPMSGKSYRRHPLADFSGSESEHLYIPNEAYDAHVLEERESELIRLLVSLGATRISITKTTINTKSGHFNAGASVEAGPLMAADTNFASDSRHASDMSDARIFCLNGYAWNPSQKINPKDFFWLAFEPSWKAVLFAREYGGCTEASLDLKENTSFSEDKSIELTIKLKEFGGGASGGLGVNNNEQRINVIDVKFAPVENKN